MPGGIENKRGEGGFRLREDHPWCVVLTVEGCCVTGTEEGETPCNRDNEGNAM